MKKDGKQTVCTLLGHGEYGWEVILLRDGEWFYGRRWMLRAEALAEADALRREHERDGWTIASGMTVTDLGGTHVRRRACVWTLPHFVVRGQIRGTDNDRPVENVPVLS
jgi:hypothetical protein